MLTVLDTVVSEDVLLLQTSITPELLRFFITILVSLFDADLFATATLCAFNDKVLTWDNESLMPSFNIFVLANDVPLFQVKSLLAQNPIRIE